MCLWFLVVFPSGILMCAGSVCLFRAVLLRLRFGLEPGTWSARTILTAFESLAHFPSCLKEPSLKHYPFEALFLSSSHLFFLSLSFFFAAADSAESSLNISEIWLTVQLWPLRFWRSIVPSINTALVNMPLKGYTRIEKFLPVLDFANLGLFSLLQSCARWLLRGESWFHPRMSKCQLTICNFLFWIGSVALPTYHWDW